MSCARNTSIRRSYLRAIPLEVLQLVARRAEGAGRRVAKCADRCRVLAPDVDQVLGQGADDAVAPGIEMPDAVAVPAAGLDDAQCAGVDDGGHAAGLRVQGIARRWFFLHASCHSCVVVPGRSGFPGGGTAPWGAKHS